MRMLPHSFVRMCSALSIVFDWISIWDNFGSAIVWALNESRQRRHQRSLSHLICLRHAARLLLPPYTHAYCVCVLLCVSVCQARYSCISIVDRLFIFWLWISCANQHSVNLGFGWAQMLCSTNVNWMERWICVRRWFIHRKCLNWLHFGKCCCDCFKCIVAQHRGYEYIFCVTLPHTSIGVDWSQCHWPMKILLHTMPAVNSNSQRIINHY